MPTRTEYKAALNKRFEFLKAKGRYNLTSSEKTELCSIHERLEALRIGENFDLPPGVIIIKMKFEGKCRGCTKRLKSGHHFVKFVRESRESFCLTCGPGQPATVKTSLVPVEKLDDFLSN